MCFGGNLGGCEARRLWCCCILMPRQANFGGLKNMARTARLKRRPCARLIWTLVRAASRLIGRLPGGYREYRRNQLRRS